MASSPDVQHVTVGQIELAYTTAGRATHPPVVLISGLGGQLIAWEDDFCLALVERDLHVIRFDNRDAGLSTHLPSQTDHSLDAGATGELPPPAYALADLAADTAGLIDALGLDAAHVVGVSMGGMIAQLVAITHPDRVRSLTSIMSTTGDPSVGEASDEAQALLLTPRAPTREAVMEGSVLAARVLGSPGYPTPDAELRDRAGRAFDRAFHPEGYVRQLMACVTAPDRTDQLRQLNVPTLVIHGTDDQLIGVSGGRATAAAVPDAELVVIDGMGHDLPRQLWPVVIDRIVELVERAEVGTGVDG